MVGYRSGKVLVVQEELILVAEHEIGQENDQSHRGRVTVVDLETVIVQGVKDVIENETPTNTTSEGLNEMTRNVMIHSVTIKMILAGTLGGSGIDDQINAETVHVSIAVTMK